MRLAGDNFWLVCIIVILIVGGAVGGGVGGVLASKKSKYVARFFSLNTLRKI